MPGIVRCVVCICVAMFRLGVAAEQHESPDKSKTIDALIKDLGAEDFQLCQDAHAALAAMGVEAKPALELALKSKDAEICMRTRELLAPIYIQESYENEQKWFSANLMPLFGARELNAKRDIQKTIQKRDSEISVAEGGLKWIASVQDADGHWDSMKFGSQVDADIEQTALALLAMLGAGYTEKVGQHKKSVQDGIAWLRKQMREDGAFIRDGKPLSGASCALAGLALSEAAGMARRPETMQAAQRAVDYSVSLQQTLEDKKSGFGATEKAVPDVFTTTLFCMMLKSAKIAALKVPYESFEGMREFIESMHDKETRLFRMSSGEKPSPRASLMGCTGLQFMGYDRERLREWVEAMRPLLKPPDDPSGDVFLAYVGSILTLQMGGEIWKEYNESKMKIGEYAINGANDECWFEAQGEWAGAGKLFATSLNCLSLMTYNRRGWGP